MAIPMNKHSPVMCKCIYFPAVMYAVVVYTKGILSTNCYGYVVVVCIQLHCLPTFEHTSAHWAIKT